MAERTCSIEGCERVVVARGYCRACYYRMRKAGVIQTLQPSKPRKVPKPCSIDGCEAFAICRGYCDRHYTRLKRHGDPLGWSYGLITERFWAKVDIAGPIPKSCPHLGRCWVWTASRQPKGYGCFDGGLAHRWSYEHCLRPIPVDLELDHLCKNRSCVNPAHLEPVTHLENIRRAWA